MTKKQKLILFIVCAFLFILSAITIIYYSQGFRFDFENKKITQTGAFSFKILPRNTQVYLNDKFIKKTDFFNLIYIDNILPKKYNISIKKEGYFNWEKTLEIKEKDVTEAKNIVLIKESINFSLLLKEVEKLFFSPNETKIILLEKKDNNWELKSYDLRTNVKSHLIKSVDLSKEKQDFKNLIISPDSNKILLETSFKNKISYFLVDLNKSPVQLIPLNFLGEDIENVYFHPKDNQKIIFFQKETIIEADYSKKEILPTFIENVISWNTYGSSIYYLDKNGYIIKADIASSQKEKINEIAFPVKEKTIYEIFILNEFYFLKEGSDLYLLNFENKSFEKFSEKNKKIKISPDGQKAVYFSNSEILIFFLKEQKGQPFKQYGEKTFLARFSETIEDVFWLTSHYLIFNKKDEIKILEIDDRDKINIINLTQYKEPKIHFSQSDKKLYILSENNFFASEPLI